MKFPHLYFLAFAFPVAALLFALYAHHQADVAIECARALGRCGSAEACEPWAERCDWLP